METRTCTACGQTFQPHHKVPTQTYCSSSECQKARRQNWQRNTQQSDPDYRDNQRRVQQAWIERNPDYWRDYRKSNVKSSWRAIKDKFGHWNAVISIREILHKYQQVKKTKGQKC